MGGWTRTTPYSLSEEGVVRISESIRYDRMIPTPEEWYPCHEDQMVKVFVSLRKFEDRTGEYWLVMTGAWGADDHGMEKQRRFEPREGARARAEFEEIQRWIKGVAIVTHQMLIDRGYQQA
jgi:hypothetical protein